MATKNTVYENVVLESKATDLLTTSINTRSLMTIDNDLTQEAGMKKSVNTYTYTGEAEVLGNGEGNTAENRGSISFTTDEYEVQMVQQAFDYTDEEYMKDNTIVDNMLKGANQVMVNKITSDFIAAVEKATLEVPAVASLGYEAIVDGISLLNIEDESGLFVVIPNTWKADLRKDEDYKAARMGEVIYNGQVGSVAGIPVIATKALTDAAYVMSKEAVKLFIKKDVEVEQDRDADTRTNSVYLRSTYLVSLVDATQIAKIKKAA